MARFDQLVEHAWDDLRRLSRRSIRAQQGAVRFAEPTSLLAEAMGRLTAQESKPTNAAQLKGLATLALRRALADRMRRGLAAKRDRAGMADLARARAGVARAAGDEVVGEELRARVLAGLEALGELDPRAAEALFLTAQAGMRAAEVADELGVSTPTVERDLRAARAFMAAWIETGGEG